MIEMIKAHSTQNRSSDQREAEMRKLIADEWMTLDGVIQAPGQPDENPSGGFQHGGWHVGYFDDLAQRQVVDSVVNAGNLDGSLWTEVGRVGLDRPVLQVLAEHPQLAPSGANGRRISDALPVSTLWACPAPDVAAAGCSPPPSFGVVTLRIGLF
jgi:hypothetical protein